LDMQVSDLREYFGSDDVSVSEDHTLLAVFGLIIPRTAIMKALNFAREKGCVFYIKESEERKGVELCFRTQKEKKMVSAKSKEEKT